MSEPKLIEPLLKNHIMGAPISQHHGVRCCPALLKDTDQKFIVKIVSIPAKESQLAALLLTGACADEADAQRYFLRQADAVTAEAQLLKKLSSLEGFRGYEDWQIYTEDDAIGCDVYLLSRYSHTLATLLKNNALTHLSAVNLGLDLCAALSLCRRHGHIYLDLRPENVILNENGEFRICDLGFISLDSLKYISLPDKYRSAYTAPEVADEYACLNTTLDTYAAGLILYQVFNGGALPQDMSEPPIYADYDMAQIILKACAADPADRWEDPQQLGQALVSYMQGHTVNDTPIIPLPEPEPEEESVVEAAEEPEAEQDVQASTEASETVDEPTDEVTETAEEVETEEIAEESTEEPTIEEEPTVVDHIPDELEIAEQFVIDGFLFDGDVTTDDTDLFSEEMDQMLAQADELIAHQTPDPVVAPEAIDIPMPEPIVLEPEEVPEEKTQPEEETPEVEEEEEVSEEAPKAEPLHFTDSEDEEEYESSRPKTRKKLTGLICTLIVVLVVALLAAGGFYYYQNIYLQTIHDVTADVFEDQAVITVDTNADNSLLTVICTDIYGNSRQLPLVDGKATFTDLNAGTTYKITLSISGHHKLIGTTTTGFSTATQTNILNFTAIAGDSDGSVILNFSVQGPDSNAWSVHYSTPGEPEREVACTGHMATINGLTVGAEYTFWLVPEEELYVIGSDSMVYTALPLIFAQDLTIHGYHSGKLLVTWNVPEGMTVENWYIRCYNNDGFEFSTTITDTSIAIEGLDPANSYTVEVKAEGMTVSKWTTITENSVTFQDITINNVFDGSISDTLYITWTYEGVAPAGGWQISYTIDNGERQFITTTDNYVSIFPVMPGCTYSFSFVMPEGITSFGGTAEYTAPHTTFDLLGAQAENFTFRMCYRPQGENWRWYYLWEDDFTNSYLVGQQASFVVHVDGQLLEGDASLTTLFIIRDSEGNLVDVSAGKTLNWATMWDRNYTELDMPVMPSTAGQYTVNIYFGQAYVTSVDFAVVENSN